ncbi:MAG TPA: hypothetical protein VK395_10750 [Gemmataceae bacterium]|nr:hypothetical protein [Gemmataceae bacterium]
MSEPITLTAVAKLATLLPPTEQKQLAESILQRLASTPAPDLRRRAWHEIRGSVAYPLCGEDAQAWVTRSRQESQDQREQQWRSNR